MHIKQQFEMQNVSIGRSLKNGTVRITISLFETSDRFEEELCVFQFRLQFLHCTVARTVVLILSFSFQKNIKEYNQE